MSADHDLSDSVQLILSNLDMSVSPYNRVSLISAINEGKTQRTDAYLQRLINASRQVWRQSGGAFDRLSCLWSMHGASLQERHGAQPVTNLSTRYSPL